MDDRFYFRQLLSGRDFAVGDQIATQMVNFAYLIGDRASGEAIVVDPAYRVADLVEIAAEDGMRITGALASHYHADHIGGSMMGYKLEGVKELLAHADAKVHVHRDEAPWVMRTTGLGATDLVQHDSGDTIEVGGVRIQLLHTPGHTPGSQCFLVEGYLVAGDTLFLEGCGRTDLPGSNVDDMYDSLQRLCRLPDETVLFPGHRYSFASSATMDMVKQLNYVFKPKTKEQWLMMFGG